MAGRYRGSRQLPDTQKAPWYTRAGRFLARRGYDVINAAVPGTVFDYREHNDINPARAFRDGTLAETARWAAGKPEGMSDEEWQRVRQEGREGLFDSAWDLLPIPRVPVVSGAIRRGARNMLLGNRQMKPRDTNTSTVVPTVSGAGVTTTEAPITTTSGKPSAEGTNTSRQGRSSTTSSSGTKPRFAPFAGNTSGTRGSGWGDAGDPQDFMTMLGNAGNGLGYKPVAGEFRQWAPLAFSDPDLVNTVTGQAVVLDRNGTPMTGRESMLTRSRQMAD